MKRVVFVGNNWEGTVDLLEPGTFDRLGRIDMIPDQDARMMEIATNPERLAYYLAIREAIGEGHDQLVDDMYTSNDGRLLIASRPSYADVVAVSIETGELVWRFPVAGQRADHMAISPDGRKLVVSASTANLVHVLRVSDGKELGTFPSGGSPHENVFIDGGKRIIHASIGYVYTPTDQDLADPAKGERVFEIVSAKKPFKVERRYNLRKALDARGLDDLSTAVRPMTLSPDEKTRLLPGVVLPRLPGDVAEDRRDRAGQAAPEPDPEHAARAVPPRLRPPRHRDEPVRHEDLRRRHHVRLRDGREDPRLRPRPAAEEEGRQAVLGHPELERPALLHLLERHRPDRQDLLPNRADRRPEARSGDHPQRIRNGFVDRDLLAGLPRPADLPPYEPMPPIVGG